jgi:hypothetical protein
MRQTLKSFMLLMEQEYEVHNSNGGSPLDFPIHGRH